ncbi:hypothetical protein [Pseudolactococcus reticulitermitis]|uniref:Uncharacterized protein n=1 Tax=Pseudolactococcus reticulitermitis TaxID=2025039 RepID=A0A224X9D0_9LACT|nr:hypothetical protein [Lactococcus reticulitermitis]GAX46794.1 hypothetical protein RsY01_374 [Lactococcus reticulitermitis]
MKTNFAKYLDDNNLEIFDVAKMLRDSNWNQNAKHPKTREAFVRLLAIVPSCGWGTLKGKGGKRFPGVYDLYDGAISAWRVAQIIGCKVGDIT